MTQSLHPAAQNGFRSAAELYQHARPDYPNQVLQWLEDELMLDANAQVIDLGAGTGKFIPYLAQITPQIHAVEPVAEMLAQLKLAYPNVDAVQAYSYPLPFASHSIDAVICAQSFHWFANIETLSEIYDVLKPQGHLGLIWNQRDIDVDWVNALAEVIAPFEGDTPRYHHHDWKHVFEHQYLFQLHSVQSFQHIHRGTVEHVVSNRLLSTSFIAAMPTVQQQQLKRQFEQIVQDYTGKSAQDEIEFPYVTYAYHFKKHA